MAEKPIIFSTEMVQALLAGRKTQTRRVVHSGERTPHNLNCTKLYKRVDTLKGKPFYGAGFCSDTAKKYMNDIEYFKALCKPGDLLWVRETWCEYDGEYYYRADDKGELYANEFASVPFGQAMKDLNLKWRSPIHMPRKAARILLRVKDVRLEKLQFISYEDCCAEGVYPLENLKSFYHSSAYTEPFRKLWDSINKKRDRWDMNPWVWVYEFERVETCR